MKREIPDFHYIRPEHVEVHERLLNWSRWCRGSFTVTVQPMFRHYRHGYEEPRVSSDVDQLDGHRIEKAVVALPAKHRTALQWAYTKPWVPVLAVRKVLGLTHPALSQMLHDARTMLRNRLQEE